MIEKTTEKTYEITNTVKTYIAEDGKEFSDMNKCVIYESELELNHYADKYKIKFISVPTFICNDDYVHGISFYFPQDGNEDEVIRLLSIYQNYEIYKSDERWEINWVRNLSNVRDSKLEIKIPFELSKGDNYVFYFCWEEYNDDYDYFYNQIVSKETAMTKLKKEIKEFEEIFGSEIDTVYARGK
jgi:hypothetical protein